jgi:hypothetical protein
LRKSKLIVGNPDGIGPAELILRIKSLGTKKKASTETRIKATNDAGTFS